MNRLAACMLIHLLLVLLSGVVTAHATELPDLVLSGVKKEHAEEFTGPRHQLKINLPGETANETQSIRLEVLKGFSKSPSLYRTGDVDYSSLKGVVDSVVTPGMTDEQKALALWRFVMNCCYIGRWGTSLDGLEHLNVYGYGYCGSFAAVLEPLWWTAGLKGRHLNIGNHAATEVYYGNDWHYIDANTRSYYLLKDNRSIASLEDLNNDISLWNMTRKGSSRKEGKKQYYMTMHPSGHGRSPVYSNDFTMAKGDRLDLTWQKKGKWCLTRGEEGGKEPAPEPPIYANGTFTFHRDLTDPEQCRIGLVSSKNIDWQDRTTKYLHPAKAKTETELIYQVRTPYFIPEATISGSFVRSNQGDPLGIDISFDNGKKWLPLCRAEKTGNVTLSATTALTQQVTTDVPWKYSYLVRVRMKATNAPRDVGGYLLESSNTLVYNPKSLPGLRKGENPITFRDEAGTNRSVRATWTWMEDLPIMFSKANPLEGEEITLRARVANRGKGEARNVAVVFYHGDPDKGGSEIGRETIGHLAPGASAEASIRWKATRKLLDKKGKTEGAAIFAVVDPENRVAEKDKSNNIFSRLLKVLNPPDVRIPDQSFVRFRRGASPEKLVIQATVRNFSNSENYGFYLDDHAAGEDIQLKFFDGDPLKGGRLIAEQRVDHILPLEHRNLDVPWDIKGLKGVHRIYVQVYPPKNLFVALGTKASVVVVSVIDLDRYRVCGKEG